MYNIIVWVDYRCVQNYNRNRRGIHMPIYHEYLKLKSEEKDG